MGQLEKKRMACVGHPILQEYLLMINYDFSSEDRTFASISDEVSHRTECMEVIEKVTKDGTEVK